MKIKDIKDSFGKFINTFRVKKEEVIPSLVILVLMASLNVLAVSKYYTAFSKTHQAIWGLFVKYYHVSGFDPITYCVLTEWEPKYNIYRHPLLTFFEYPFYLLNQGLAILFDKNMAQVIVAVLLVFFAYYTWIFLYRIIREIVGLGRTDSTLLSMFFYSFGYVMLTLMVPDHFAVSMFMLVTCLYVCGKAIQKGKQLKIWQTWIIFFLTAGTTLSNGIKVFLDALFVNKWRFFRPKYFLLAVIVPSALIWVFARWEYKQYVWPREMAQLQKKRAAAKKEDNKLLAQFKDTTSLKDSTQIAKAFKKLKRRKMHEKYLADHKKMWNVNKGTPMGKGEFMQWTDESTSRIDALVENIFGEPIQIHKRYLLGDVLRDRPTVVRYDNALNYIVEGIIVLMFLAGILAGIRSKFFLMVLSGVTFDAVIHLGLGFGLNEVFIMSGHWIFVIPIAVAYLFRRIHGNMALAILRTLTLVLTLFLFAYNITLFISYFA